MTHSKKLHERSRQQAKENPDGLTTTTYGTAAEGIRCARCGQHYWFKRIGLAPDDWPKWCDRCDKEINEEDS